MSFDADANRRRFLQFLAASPLFAASAEEKSRPATKFERRGLARGHPVRDVVFRRGNR